MNQYYRKTIHMMAWTPDLISLFEELRVAITSSPVLARFHLLKPTFIKTDWSAEGMGWILMQPADDIESTARLISVKMVLDYIQFDLDREHAQILNENIIRS